MVQTRNQKRWLVVVGLTLATCATASFTACDDDGVTADCPAMPILSFGGDGQPGEPIGETKWNDPSLGPGGAMNRWQLAAEAAHCACPPKPNVDDNGEPTGPTRFSNPALGRGGALNRWRIASEAVGCPVPALGGSSGN